MTTPHEGAPTPRLPRSRVGGGLRLTADVTDVDVSEVPGGVETTIHLTGCTDTDERTLLRRAVMSRDLGFLTGVRQAMAFFKQKGVA